MTPEQRRAEIDRKFPFHVDVPYLDDWAAAWERMDFLITHIGMFDMYVVTEAGWSRVRHCFAMEADAEQFRAHLQEKHRIRTGARPEPAISVDVRRDVDGRYPFHVDLPHVVDEREAARLNHYIVAHIGRFATYETCNNGRPRSRYCFRTFEEAEMFRWGLAGKANRRSSR